MATRVRTEHDLPTVRIAYQDGGRETVRFWLVTGGGDPKQVAECRATALGPVDFRDDQVATDGEFRLPREVVADLSEGTRELAPSPAPPDNALWLELASPRGYLHLVPWERLLAPLGRPLVRLPNYHLRPRAQSHTLEVALCASSSVPGGRFDPAAALARLARMWLTVSGMPTTVHLFSDAWAHEQLLDLVGDQAGVVVADPSGWADVAHPVPGLNSSWLQWISGALGRRAVEVVHLVGYGHLAGGRGAVALADSPTSPVRKHAEFVGTAQLAQFVAGRGAWTVVVSGPPDNYFGPALREVTDALARNSPGISLAHDLGLDPDLEQLARVVELVFAGQDSITGPLPGICAWAHPKFVEYPAEHLVTRTGHSAMVREVTQAVLAAPDTPTSIASATRYLESLQATWTAPGADAVDPDARIALGRVSDLLERHSQRYRPDDPRDQP